MSPKSDKNPRNGQLVLGRSVQREQRRRCRHGELRPPGGRQWMSGQRGDTPPDRAGAQAAVSTRRVTPPRRSRRGGCLSKGATPPLERPARGKKLYPAVTFSRSLLISTGYSSSIERRFSGPQGSRRGKFRDPDRNFRDPRLEVAAQIPKFGIEALVEGRLQIRGPRRAAGPGLRSDLALDHQNVTLAPQSEQLVVGH